MILLTVPLGISGGIVGLWLLNLVGGELSRFGLSNIQQPFDVITMLGFVVLIGTVVNNPILLVEKALRNLKAGMGTIEAVLESTRSRLRPIVMSTITTVFGLSPLVLNPGAGTELYRGLGRHCFIRFAIFFYRHNHVYACVVDDGLSLAVTTGQGPRTGKSFLKQN